MLLWGLLLLKVASQLSSPGSPTECPHLDQSNIQNHHYANSTYSNGYRLTEPSRRFICWVSPDALHLSGSQA